MSTLIILGSKKVDARYCSCPKCPINVPWPNLAPIATEILSCSAAADGKIAVQSGKLKLHNVAMLMLLKTKKPLHIM